MFGFTDIKGLTDEQLVALAAKADRKAFAELYERYHNKLVRFVFSYAMDAELAEDVVHDVFVKIIEQPQKFDVNRRFNTWLYTVAINRLKNVRRDERNRQRLLDTTVYEARQGAASAEQGSLKDQDLLAGKIKEVLAGVSDKENMIYLLRFNEGLSIPEIAKVLELPEGSVKSCIHYLLRKFKQQLKDFDK